MSARAHTAWYLVHCKSRQDARAEEHLQRQGYTCFRSTYKRERLMKGQRKTTQESLFPGYLFVQMSLQDSWSALRSTRGVARIVGFGPHPLAISDALVGELQVREHHAVVTSLLQPGESVRINQGPFAELEAVFLAMDGEERVVLLMNFLQREQRINLPLAEISRVRANAWHKT
ncbi:transcription/translation regulatory transformer protein RfaH [Pseudomonas sp. Bout1]|uniref:transcription/translation regulatory transformer protein RfaH n=1 Tax=Pseudomonas sp. Bout1 TaxID=3048600 RepID=UPI002AB46089|nr:transcription/translation regulatory transformer protein RfaH [Pseudomonas sp. Bout1]MDY7533823.1 transcription/translation regulatory transformer protein RfaH [Pseudomonas sp. Bout1]MEB0186844.1 transcription/translation regulatory transformer protein RfaH [Pseudomonas sp. Bout1]